MTLAEYETAHAVWLSDDERGALLRLAPSVTVAPAADATGQPKGRSRHPGAGGWYDLTPGSWAGAVDLGTLAIEIQPKLPIDRVLFLISYALDPRRWHDSPFDLEAAPSLLEAVVPAFTSQAQRALRRGVLHGYCTVDASLPAVRGRIRFDAQVRDRFGLAPPAEVRHDEFTDDIDENRLLKAAAMRLGRLCLRSSAAARSLARLEAALARVTHVDYDAARLPAIHRTRLNAHYHRALELARLILRWSSFELRHGEAPATAFLVDMNQVFEDFVVVALREALRLTEHTFPQGAGGRRRLALDEAGAVHLQPDLSWWDGDRCSFVGDVKYKRVTATGIEHPDLYQLLAYVVAAGLPGGLLVYAAGEAEPASHDVLHAGKVLHVTALDLAGSPSDILAQIDAVAERVRHLRRLARRTSVA